MITTFRRAAAAVLIGAGAITGLSATPALAQGSAQSTTIAASKTITPGVAYTQGYWMNHPAQWPCLISVLTSFNEAAAGTSTGTAAQCANLGARELKLRE